MDSETVDNITWKALETFQRISANINLAVDNLAALAGVAERIADSLRNVETALIEEAEEHEQKESSQLLALLHRFYDVAAPQDNKDTTDEVFDEVERVLGIGNAAD